MSDKLRLEDIIYKCRCSVRIFILNEDKIIEGKSPSKINPYLDYTIESIIPYLEFGQGVFQSSGSIESGIEIRVWKEEI